MNQHRPKASRITIIKLGVSEALAVLHNMGGGPLETWYESAVTMRAQNDVIAHTLLKKGLPATAGMKCCVKQGIHVPI